MRTALFTFFNKYKYHILVWSIFIAYEAIIESLIGATMKNSTLVLYIISYSLHIFLFYFHAHVLLKYTLESKNKLFKYSFPLFIIVELVGYIIIRFLIGKYYFKFAESYNADLNNFIKTVFVRAVWRGIYFIGISTVYYFALYDQQQKQKIREMKQQELRANLLDKEIKSELISTQNAFLRAQINPHFLINTLSYLYTTTRKKVPKAAESMLSLSELMQYALSKEISSEHVKLESEISLVESFLSLYQAQRDFKVHLNLSYDHEMSAVPIIPLLLMSLTETILRRSDLSNPLKPANIKIIYEHSVLSIETYHTEVMGNPIPKDDENLKTISSRLFQTYENRVAFNFHLNSNNCLHTSIKLQF